MLKIDEQEVAALYSAGHFDAEFYAAAYPDVAESGLDPAFHFLWVGARLGRLPSEPKQLLGVSTTYELDLLFIDGTNGTSSTPYRVDRVASALADLGARVHCVRGADVSDAMKDLPDVRYVTFFRAPFVEPYSSFACQMRSRGSRIVFDIDDLIFDQDQIPIIDGYRYLSEVEKVTYRRGVRAYRDFVLYADFCTAPTEFLADQMRLLGKRAFKIRNTIDRTEIERFQSSTCRTDEQEFVIGYYSGSKTHQADFHNAAVALTRFLDEEPKARFRLVGHLDLEEYPGLRANARVTAIGTMAHSDMLQDQANCDLIIAPLQVANPFCEAKSELKFFEASLARRAVIASPTGTFQTATLQGTLAQLADKPDEWLQAFRVAVRDRDALWQLANRAHDYVVRTYCQAAAGRDAVLAYSDAPVELCPAAD